MNISLANDYTLMDVAAIRAGISAHNLAAVPELRAQPHGDLMVVARDAQGNPTGGTVSDYGWGWLYVDTLWVDAAYRGQGLGSRIMAATEESARRVGIPHAYLFTSGFQARAFYEKLGYTVFGTNPDRPRGYTTYYLKRESLPPQTIDPALDIRHEIIDADRRTLEAGLIRHAADYAPVDPVPLGALIRSDGGAVMGGVTGYTFWDWFDMRYLWVHESLRGQGYGRRLMALVAAECRRRKMVGIVTDTASFQALPFYQRLGFTVMGTLRDRPPGHESYFIQRLL